MLTARAASIVARVCLVGLFPFSAADKIIHRKQALKQAKSSILPVAPAMLDVAIAVEAITPICIVTGRYDRAAAGVLAGFCTVTALLYHQFWTYDDLTARGKSQGREELWEFLKNFGLVGGLLLVVFGKELESLQDVVRHPLTTSKPAPRRRLS